MRPCESGNDPVQEREREMTTFARLTAGAALATALGFAATATASAQECEPSKWGADDEIGAANYVTPEQVKMAVGLVKEGKTHPLGIVIDPEMPAFPPRGMMLEVVQPNQHFGASLEGGFGWPMAYNDDMLQTWIGIGPQLDGLGHLGEGAGDEAMFYNCTKGQDFAKVTGLTKFGIHNVPPLVGRGVLLDMAEHLGVDHMEAGQGITSDDIKAAAEAQGVEIREGDVVIFHTGWTDAMLESDPAAWGAGQPGVTNEASEYLASLGIMAVGLDSWSVGAVPAVEGDKVFYDHVIFLRDNGIYILEGMNTGRLAEEDVSEFMFVLGQPRFKGAVQSMINPVALW